jgi:hypothetical protein
VDSTTVIAVIVGISWNLLVFRIVRQVWEKLYGNEPIVIGVNGGDDGKRSSD